MSTDELHTPTSAAPPPISEPASAGGSVSASPPSASPSPTERPEVQVGAAFAGGLLAALILKRIVP